MSSNLVNNKYKKNLKFIYLLVFCLLNIQTYLINSSIPMSFQSHIKILYTFISIISILLLITKIIFDNHTIIEYMTIGLIFLLSIIIWHISNELIIPQLILLIIGAKNIHFTNIMKIFFDTDFTLTILLIISSLIRIIPNITTGAHTGSILNARYSLGFGGPVKLSESILTLCVVYSLIHLKRITWTRIFILLILSYFVLAIPNTRMDFYAMLLLTIITVIHKLSPSLEHKFPLNLAWLALPIMTFITFYLAIFYNTLINSSTFIVNLDKSLEYRLLYSSYWLTSSKISLFGKNLTKTTQIVSPTGIPIYNYIDQSMIRIFVMYGIIAFTMFLIIYTYQMFKLHRAGLDFFVLLFMVIVFRGFFDVNMIQITGNPFLLIIFANLGNIEQFIRSSKNKQIIRNQNK